jgi:carbon monoxide dehydrogenase subunit G
MEKLLNEFTVNRSIAHAWAILTDLERIAPCMPGAQLQEIEGDIYRGQVKVKLGPISTSFKGQAVFLERDDANHRAVLKGEGRDTGGKGNADALITAQLEAVSPHHTKCTVSTDLRVSGKVAQFGRGVMGDVSEKLMSQFAHNLNTMLDSEDDTPDEAEALVEEAIQHAEEVKAHAAEVPPAAAAAATQGAPAAAEAPKVRTIQGPAAEPIELSDVAGSAMLKRLLPLLGGLVVLLVVLRRLRK